MNIERPVEHCAVFGISTSINEAGGITYNALLSMQHRGQEGAGIAVLSPDGKLLYHKGLGLVSEVFDEIDKLPKAHIAIGHVRYSTTGSDVCANVQPFVAEYLTGRIAAAHNGNVTNAKELREQLTGRGVNFSATSDSEVVSSLIGYFCVTTGDPVQSVKRAAAMLEGAFCLVVLTGDGKLIAVRDAHGYRPLCIGENEFGMCVASESCGAECSGFNFKRNIAPGEIVVIREGKEIYSEVFLSPKDSRAGMCVFEFVYFARTDSVI
ncbi:MAG: class II glutamine amidotransferase, partial [Clostridiales bacterium]|nr:class II glutamine amidotransferase [Clostridiales bacterium]